MPLLPSVGGGEFFAELFPEGGDDVAWHELRRASLEGFFKCSSEQFAWWLFAGVSEERGGLVGGLL